MATQPVIDEALQNRARFAVKLSAVQGKVHNVRKSERNSAQGYNYASTESILAMVRPILVECGLAALMTTRAIDLTSEPGTDKQGNPITNSGAHISLDITLIDTDTGYSETMTFEGYGNDRGDKAVPKAYTMAAKYWARTAFMIDLQADAEHDGQTRQSQPVRQAPAPPSPPSVVSNKPAAPVGDTRPTEQLLGRAALAADYNRLYLKAADLGLTPKSTDDKLLPETIPAAWKDESAQRLHAYLKEMVDAAEPSMATRAA